MSTKRSSRVSRGSSGLARGSATRPAAEHAYNEFTSGAPPEGFAIATAMPVDGACMYRSTRDESGRLDSSPFELRLLLSESLRRTLMPVARGDSGRSALEGRLFVEAVRWDGRQLTVYTDDLPHESPLEPLQVEVRRLDDRNEAVIAVHRGELPLSSSYANAKFRLAVAIMPVEGSGDAPIVHFTETFRVLAKMGTEGSRPKQKHFEEYKQLAVPRCLALRAIVAASAAQRDAMNERMESGITGVIHDEAMQTVEVVGEGPVHTLTTGVHEAEVASFMSRTGGAPATSEADDEDMEEDREARAASNAARTSARKRAVPVHTEQRASPSDIHATRGKRLRDDAADLDPDTSTHLVPSSYSRKEPHLATVMEAVPAVPQLIAQMSMASGLGRSLTENIPRNASVGLPFSFTGSLSLGLTPSPDMALPVSSTTLQSRPSMDDPVSALNQSQLLANVFGRQSSVNLGEAFSGVPAGAEPER